MLGKAEPHYQFAPAKFHLYPGTRKSGIFESFLFKVENSRKKKLIKVGKRELTKHVYSIDLLHSIYRNKIEDLVFE